MQSLSPLPLYRGKSILPPMSASAPATTARPKPSADSTLGPRDRRLGRTRVVIESPNPSVDGGRFPAKCSVGETVRVEVDAFADGHDKVAVALRHHADDSDDWEEVDMIPLVNDRWAGEFEVHCVGW